MQKIIVVSGGFDPVHSGHIKLIKEARLLGDMLIVGINSDEWLARKKGRAFMPWQERLCILNNLSSVDEVYTFDDEDGTACHLLEQVRAHYPDSQIVFANGGDRTEKNIPEQSVAGIEFAFGIGGENKANSSSWILQEWKTPKTERTWGYYRVLHEDGQQVKVKELTVNPGQRLSMQRHTDRAEHWFVSQGTATVNTLNTKSDVELLGEFDQFQHIHIDRTEWHQLCNLTEEPLKVVEIQYGPNCVEEDIERRSI
jgi:D-beta-D-heptose 7-phosphate kinase/D-beta-D-heptose 1-phosphate adenosyltransferase